MTGDEKRIPTGPRWSRLVVIAAAFLLVSAGTYKMYRRPAYPVTAIGETDPVPNSGDAADDPCIWIHPSDPQRSLIIGTDKKGGLAVFGLDGRTRQFLEVGRLNNVDVRDDFPFAGGPAPVVAASNKTDDCVDLFRIDPETTEVTFALRADGPRDLRPDGLCLYRSAATGDTYAFVTTKAGELGQIRLTRTGGELVRRVTLGSECEGCVADDELGFVYVAEENVGIWKLRAEPDASDERALVERVGALGRITHDVEGLAILPVAPGRGFLIASSQGSDDFLVFEREGGQRCLGRFRVAAAAGIDGVTHTDGIDVSPLSIPGRFPRGLLVLQDDENDDENQNFKLVSWEDVERVLEWPF